MEVHDLSLETLAKLARVLERISPDEPPIQEIFHRTTESEPLRNVPTIRSIFEAWYIPSLGIAVAIERYRTNGASRPEEAHTSALIDSKREAIDFALACEQSWLAELAQRHGALVAAHEEPIQSSQ